MRNLFFKGSEITTRTPGEMIDEAAKNGDHVRKPGEFSIHYDYELLLPQLEDDEFLALKEDIRANGVRDPITISQAGLLLDGHNRTRIVEALNSEPNSIEKGLKWELPYVVRKVADDDEARVFIITNQTGRRNITRAMRTFLALKIKDSIARIAAKNMALGGLRGAQATKEKFKGPFEEFFKGPSNEFESNVAPQRSEESLKHDRIDPYQPPMVGGKVVVKGDIPKALDKINTRAAIAKIAGVSVFFVEQFETVAVNSPQSIPDILSGKLSVNSVSTKLKREGQKEVDKKNLEAHAELTRNIDLGVEFDQRFYTQSGMKSKVVIVYYDENLESISRNVLNDSKYYIVVAPLKNTHDVMKIVHPKMNFAGATVIDSSLGVVLAHVFGPKTELPELLSGDPSEAIGDLLRELITAGDVVINPYPADAIFAKAIKAAEGKAIIFTGGNEEVENKVRVELAPME